MKGYNVDSDHVIAELVGMGFDFSDITEAVKSVGASLDDAVEFILNGSRRTNSSASSSSACLNVSNKVLGKRTTSSTESFGKMRQQSITEHLMSASRAKRSKVTIESHASASKSNIMPRYVEEPEVSLPLTMDPSLNISPAMTILPSYCKDKEELRSYWEHKVNSLLGKHFGYSSLKNFQKEALEAWLSHQDCLILAATGSGKSLCFQIPALLTGKVVVVVSPLISLMHDQCLKLAKHGISACFLGSGQIDKSVEQKAISGVYNIIYVCPETILRLIKPLQSLAEGRGIALFAIDEVHCVSKWGHDFRPDYRRLCVLRENFGRDSLKFLKFDIPLMALTATATVRVREDILKSLCMLKETKIVITSFFRPNLCFSVKHSRTSSLSSYDKDFRELIEVYTTGKKSAKTYNLTPQVLEHSTENSSCSSDGSMTEVDGTCENEVHDIDDDVLPENDGVGLQLENSLNSLNEKKSSVQYLEDECDLFHDADDLDVSCGEFYGQPHIKHFDNCGSPETHNMLNKPKERPALEKGDLGEGPTIIYVPTRKETLSIAKFLSSYGVKAAAYNAKLPKSHLRQVHKDFHEDALQGHTFGSLKVLFYNGVVEKSIQVVVATIAFGMGIDKSNVRRIIHYGWPQSLEAYYQEAGRAGRDGNLADCVLYANMSRIPTLLPSQRSEEQTKQSYKMLSDCFRYGMHTSSCRAKMLVEYFGEEFSQEKCLLCDVCINGPPEMQNLIAEGQRGSMDFSYDDGVVPAFTHKRFTEKPNLRNFVSRIREQDHKFAASDFIWWRGLLRILEYRGFIMEGDEMNHVQIKFPELTESGLQLLRSALEQPFYVYPEADMLLSMRSRKSFSSFAEWGKGWADPEIRRQRLESKQTKRNCKKRKPRKRKPNLTTVRGRLAAKLSKKN
ncbi:ATP-dependent DNA helicase Q-like SIM isoform X2 [Olea europaea var. sylvestris]|uniref:ATP-dependent DNA helicase Q-like SIM isoform X2 n=1 Tax=Olea europaea var. sylvestris TaxID=158386 RepID=UPI000C1D04A9|nr:ATP-dependent DNA helicase Q-like SIM isoform X2 [Olea europaea var. sylvestris]